MSEDRSFKFEEGDVVAINGVGEVYFWCPGCCQLHMAPTITKNDNGALWSFNGNLVKPTLSPSVNISWHLPNGKLHKTCHFFVQDGSINYCGDSTHQLSGRNIPLRVPKDLR